MSAFGGGKLSPVELPVLCVGFGSRFPLLQISSTFVSKVSFRDGNEETATVTCDKVLHEFACKWCSRTALFCGICCRVPFVRVCGVSSKVGHVRRTFRQQ